MKMSLRKKSTEPIVRANDEQIKFLIDYMERHKDFAVGRFIGVQGKIKLRSQWESLTNSLNEIGPTKSSEKWQNVWKNQKRIARQKNKNVRISQRQTGNISLQSELEEKEVAVLNIIGEETSIGFGLNEGFEHPSLLSFDQINTNINEYTDLEVALLYEEMNNEDNSEILDGNILKENNELHKSDYLNLKPSTSVNQTMDIPLQSSRRSNRDVPTMSNNSKKPKLDTYMDLVKGTNDGFIAIAASLDKLATAMQNSSELINHGLMNIADAISKHA